jgi:hypothetical protein
VDITEASIDGNGFRKAFETVAEGTAERLAEEILDAVRPGAVASLAAWKPAPRIGTAFEAEATGNGA